MVSGSRAVAGQQPLWQGSGHVGCGLHYGRAHRRPALVPRDSDIDQLFVIQKLLGELQPSSQTFVSQSGSCICRL